MHLNFKVGILIVLNLSYCLQQVESHVDDHSVVLTFPFKTTITPSTKLVKTTVIGVRGSSSGLGVANGQHFRSSFAKFRRTPYTIHLKPVIHLKNLIREEETNKFINTNKNIENSSGPNTTLKTSLKPLNTTLKTSLKPLNTTLSPFAMTTRTTIRLETQTKQTTKIATTSYQLNKTISIDQPKQTKFNNSDKTNASTSSSKEFQDYHEILSKFHLFNVLKQQGLNITNRTQTSEPILLSIGIFVVVVVKLP